MDKAKMEIFLRLRIEHYKRQSREETMPYSGDAQLIAEHRHRLSAFNAKVQAYEDVLNWHRTSQAEVPETDDQWANRVAAGG